MEPDLTDFSLSRLRALKNPLPAAPVHAGHTHSLEDLLGLLPRHLLVSPDLTAGSGGSDDCVDAPAARSGPDNNRDAVQSPGLLGSAGACCKPIGVDSSLVVGGEAQRMLDYLSARGKAALAAADEDALKTGGHGGGPDCWQNFSLAASSGLALQPCNQTAPFSFARPRSPLPMCIGPLPRAPPNYPRPPSVGSFLGSAGPPHGNAFPAPDLQGLQGFLPPFATAPHLANQQQPYGGAREGPYAQGAFGPQGGAGPVSNAAAMAAMAAWGWAAASGGGGSGFPAFPPPPSAGSMLPGHAMFDYDRAGQQLQSGGMGAFGAFDAGGGGGSQQLARGVEDGTGAAGLSRGPPPPPAISRNLWLGNVMVADAEVLTQTFRAFGPIESVRVFVGRTYAFVNFAHEAHAAEAKAALEMQVIPELTSAAPLLVRFQLPPEGYSRRSAPAAS